MAERILDIDTTKAPEWAHRYRGSEFPPYGYTADVVGFAADYESQTLDALLVERGGEPFAGAHAWPGGFVDWDVDATARDAALRELREETGQRRVDYIEELRTYDTNGRDPRQFSGHENKAGQWVSTGVRIVSQAFLALFRKQGRRLRPEHGEDARQAFWSNVYEYLPWEDLRTVEGRELRGEIVDALNTWASKSARRQDQLERIEFAFGTSADDWNEERVSERLEIMHEAKLLQESHRNMWGSAPALLRRKTYGTALAFDHRRMMADALGRLRGKIKYMPVTLAALMEPEFPLVEAQMVCEAIGGRRLHKQNFRRVITQTQSFTIVEPTGGYAATGRPGPAPQLYRFVDGIELLRLDPSIRMPWI